MTSPLSFGQELLLLGVASLALVYVYYFRIWLVVAVGSDLLFAGALALAVASIAFPTPFDLMADDLVERSPLPEALAAADAQVASLRSMPSDLIDAALAKIGYEDEGDEEGGDGTGETAELAPPGPFVASIRPSVDALVALVLRGAGLVSGGFLMLTALATRGSTTTARRLQELATRLDTLERENADGAEATASPAPRATLE